MENKDFTLQTMESMFFSFHFFDSQSLELLGELLQEKNKRFLPQLISFVNEALKNVREREEKQKEFLSRSPSIEDFSIPQQPIKDERIPEPEENNEQNSPPAGFTTSKEDENIEYDEGEISRDSVDDEEHNHNGANDTFLNDEEKTEPLDPDTLPSEDKAGEGEESGSEENMEQSFLLSSSINPGETENIEYGEDETLQYLLEDDDYNPNGTCKAFLDSEGKGEALDPTTLLSKLKGKTVYFIEPPDVELDSVILTTAADSDEAKRIEYGEEDKIEEFLEDEDFNPNGDFLAFLDSEGKGEPLDLKTPLSELKGKEIFIRLPAALECTVIGEEGKTVSVRLNKKVDTMLVLREKLAKELEMGAQSINIILEKRDIGNVIVSRKLDQFPWFTVVGESKVLVKVSTGDSTLVGAIEEYDSTKNYQEMIFSVGLKGDKQLLLLPEKIEKNLAIQLSGKKKPKVVRFEKMGDKVKKVTTMASKLPLALTPTTPTKTVYYVFR